MATDSAFLPDHEPYRHVVKLRFAATELNEIDRLALEHGVSRAFLLRQAVAVGLGPAVDALEAARRAGMSVRAARPGPRAGSLYRGPRTRGPQVHVLREASRAALLDRRTISYPVQEEP